MRNGVKCGCGNSAQRRPFSDRRLAYNDSMKNIRSDTDYAALIETMPPGAVLTFGHIEWDEYEDLLRQFAGGFASRLKRSYYRSNCRDCRRAGSGPVLLASQSRCGTSGNSTLVGGCPGSE